ncbi:MAG: D-aminoacyl-tRNA deacylase [Chlamydiales bacterium]
MKILIQRVSHAHVEVEGTIVGAIGLGALVFIGVTHGDTVTQAAWLAHKLIHLRMFEDTHGKINQSLLEHKGKVLVVSQFTLYADCSAGRRPSFTQAAQPELAKQLYEQFVEEVRKGGVLVETGVFGAEMKVSLLNDGPVTLILER